MNQQMTDEWVADPSGRHQFRWVAGGQWTDTVADGGVTSVDPLPGPPPAATGPAPAGPMPYAPTPAAPASHGQAPYAQAPYGQAPYGQAPYGQAPQPVSAASSKAVIGGLVTGIGALAVIVTAFLPWVTITGVYEESISGTGDGRDGVVTLILGVILLILAGVTAATKGRVAGGFTVFFALLVTAIAAYDISNVSSAADDINQFGADFLQANVGIGLWLTLASSVVVLLGGILGLARK